MFNKLILNIFNLLTCNNNQDSSDEIFPEKFCSFNFWFDIFPPTYIHCYIAGKRMSDKDCKSQHKSCSLSQAKKLTNSLY